MPSRTLASTQSRLLLSSFPSSSVSPAEDMVTDCGRRERCWTQGSCDRTQHDEYTHVFLPLQVLQVTPPQSARTSCEINGNFPPLVPRSGCVEYTVTRKDVCTPCLNVDAMLTTRQDTGEEKRSAMSAHTKRTASGDCFGAARCPPCRPMARTRHTQQ